MFREKVKELLDDSLQKRKDLFLIDFEILEGNKIRIVIDGDNGVLVEDCMFVSRAIEHNLNRETEDFFFRSFFCRRYNTTGKQTTI